jgi:hypothetical protein
VPESAVFGPAPRVGCSHAGPDPAPRTMDTERINAIGTLLADLGTRTEQLRGYL